MSQIERLRIPGDPEWEAASAAVSDAYFPHELSPRDAGGNALDVDVAVTVLGPLRIARIGWGAEVAMRFVSSCEIGSREFKSIGFSGSRRRPCRRHRPHWRISASIPRARRHSARR